MKLFGIDEIKSALDPEHALQLIADGFVAYSEGRLNVPPVGHLGFSEPPGECHIKYGHILGDEFFAVKIATGFYGNSTLGLPSGSGIILLFSARTGFPEVLLDDAGYLTDVRTAMAGSLCARYLAPKNVQRIGIVGAGVQARLQLHYLRYATNCKDVTVWARNTEQADKFRSDIADRGYRAEATDSLEDLCGASNLIVTTTPATEPLLMSDWVQPGTHITAVGSDGGGKQELDPALFAKADLCVVDSISQCTAYGEASYAIAGGYITQDRLIELGTVIGGNEAARKTDNDISIADLTGVAVQDIQIAKSILAKLAS